MQGEQDGKMTRGPGGNEPKKRVILQVYGEDYPLKASADPDYLATLATHVDEMMHQVAAGQPGLGAGRIAVLAALQIADAYFRLKQEYEALTGIIEDEWAKRKKKA
jgi:cell division protein ZapA